MAHPQTPPPSQTSGVAIAIAVIGYFIVWLVAGGAITLGPRLSPPIYSWVGKGVVDGATYAWLAMLLTGIMAIGAFRERNFFRDFAIVFLINFIIWIGLVIVMYQRWDEAGRMQHKQSAVNAVISSEFHAGACASRVKRRLACEYSHLYPV